MTNDPSPKHPGNHPLEPNSDTPLPLLPTLDTDRRQRRCAKTRANIGKNGGLAAVFSGSGPPAAFSLWGV